MILIYLKDRKMISSSLPLFTNYSVVHKVNTKEVDLHIFPLCRNYKSRLQEIATQFGLSKFPLSLFRDFHGYLGDHVSYYFDQTKILFVGYGSKEKGGECDDDQLYKAFLHLGKTLSNHLSHFSHNNHHRINDGACDYKHIMIHLFGTSTSTNKSRNNIHKNQNEYMKRVIHHQVCGWITGYYRFDYLKEEAHKSTIHTKISFYTPHRKLSPLIKEYIQLSLIENEVRNYMNLPSNMLRIRDYISLIKRNLPKSVSMRVISKRELQKLGMNLICGVAQGSNQDCALVLLTYHGKEKVKKDPICFIGKGVMFDSGGYNLKTRGMEDMKFDMSASAIVYGIMKAHALLKSPGHYIGMLPLVENMIGKDAIRPSDVIISHSGKSVEITNTDAEGRLIIADCMSYASRFKPHMIIDVATLTGDTAHMFGGKSSAIMGNDYLANREIIKCGMKYQERIWELPMWPDYLEDLKSDVADIRNTSISHKAGAIIAGAFLSQFVPMNKTGAPVKWAHLDIAGVEVVKNSPFYHNGAKVEVLKTLYDYSSERSK